MPEASNEKSEKEEETGRLGQATAWLKGICGLLGAVIALFALWPDARKAACGITHCAEPDAKAVEGSVPAAQINAPKITRLYVHADAYNQEIMQLVTDKLTERNSIKIVAKDQADDVINIGITVSDVEGRNFKKYVSVFNNFVLLPADLRAERVEAGFRCALKDLDVVMSDDSLNNKMLKECVAGRMADRIVQILGHGQ